MKEYGNPMPTHSDMAIIPAQGRDQAAIDQDVAGARAAEHMRRQTSSQGPEWVYTKDCRPGCNADAECSSDE